MSKTTTTTPVLPTPCYDRYETFVRTHQTFIRHQQLAAAWVRYNSRSGKSTEKQELRVMRQLSIADLERMLAQRGVRVP